MWKVGYGCVYACDPRAVEGRDTVTFWLPAQLQVQWWTLFQEIRHRATEQNTCWFPLTSAHTHAHVWTHMHAYITHTLHTYTPTPNNLENNWRRYSTSTLGLNTCVYPHAHVCAHTCTHTLNMCTRKFAVIYGKVYYKTTWEDNVLKHDHKSHRSTVMDIPTNLIVKTSDLLFHIQLKSFQFQ